MSPKLGLLPHGCVPRARRVRRWLLHLFAGRLPRLRVDSGAASTGNSACKRGVSVSICVAHLNFQMSTKSWLFAEYICVEISVDFHCYSMYHHRRKAPCLQYLTSRPSIANERVTPVNKDTHAIRAGCVVQFSPHGPFVVLFCPLPRQHKSAGTARSALSMS